MPRPTAAPDGLGRPGPAGGSADPGVRDAAPPAGLYDPADEHDACGLAVLARVDGTRSAELVGAALAALGRLAHRGAAGADPDTGDGAGILLQVPDRLFRDVVPFGLPPAGSYAVGTAFLSQDPEAAAAAAEIVERLAAEEGLEVLGWRDVPVEERALGAAARASMPRQRQLFLAGRSGEAGVALDRLAYCLRKRAEHGADVYFPSLSARTLVYKGMLAPGQLAGCYPDLVDPRTDSALAVVHSRFSTNTFPSWSLAHPYRLLAHNGEINTVRGNRARMRAREARLASELLPGDLSRLLPVVSPGRSDSASFDEVLELLALTGRSLPHAVRMMMPPAWEADGELDEARRAFHAFSATVMEPWDGPACIAFSDGTVVGAALDRNGLRPARYWVTADGLVVLASEVGVLDVDPAAIVRRGRLGPGGMLVVDTAAGRILDADQVTAELAADAPYGEWLHAGLLRLEELPTRTPQPADDLPLRRRQRTFGYTEEDLRLLLAPMATTGADPVGSMGTDTPPAVLSRRPRLLFDYLAQLFAQVTNPPLDAIREELVTSLVVTTGPEYAVLAPGPSSCRRVLLPSPVLDGDDLARLVGVNDDGDLPGFGAVTVRGLYEVAGGGPALAAAIARACAEASAAVEQGAGLIVLSDRGSTAGLAPVPSLLLTSAVHHHLVRRRARLRVGLIVEAGDAREVHHLAVLVGCGAAAVHPYLAMDTVAELAGLGELGEIDAATAVRRYRRALSSGLLKVMSKMGVSTVASYTGAQLFEAFGLSAELVDAYLPGLATRLGGIGVAEIADEVARRHADAFAAARTSDTAGTSDVAGAGADPDGWLEPGGEYRWRREGELHVFDPETIFRLQHATRSKRYDIFRQYSRRVDDQSERLATLRGLLRLRTAGRRPLPLDEVEPVSAIVTRFATGAMSYGSISAEAHETIAVAMNRLGGRSNSGEGGEDPERFLPLPNGDSRRSKVKQVASARFGVTSEYLVDADDLQIKIAQGAKPGEGGQLPGHKVPPWIARTRHATPGVTLISPPPHHDIYSIEDIAQLISDLKNANTRARIHVKLVAQAGVGTVAAGVAKAHADVILVAGHDGGTGASPLGSVKHAGAPWELGLAEAQQTLLRNGLRERVVLQVDGGFRTGRDVVIAALLGAEEYGFATAPLVVSGCIMMRVCHLDTCPVGVATQDPQLRAHFTGRAEFLENYFAFVAEEIREYLAALGLRSLDEAIGRVELLEPVSGGTHFKAGKLDLSRLLHRPEAPAGTALRHTTGQDHGLDTVLDRVLLRRCEEALRTGAPVRQSLPIRNGHRSVGTMLGSEVTRRHGGDGLAEDTIDLTFVGSAGQSFGAFLPRGVTLRLVGDANDYVGKGLSGGRIVVRLPQSSPVPAERTVVAGNVILYGATGGEAFLRGLVGERFAVRNSGANAVVEGVGDHGCEYMTGGVVAVLGPTGRNFGAGMSGGTAYVLDVNPLRVNRGLVELGPLDSSDERLLRRLLHRHREQTGSVVAADLLADWSSACRRFTRVSPQGTARPVPEQRSGTPAGVLVGG